MTFRSRLALLLLAAALAPACGEDTGTLPDVLRAGLQITVEPSPLVGVQDLTGAVSIAFRVTLTETKGLGGEVVFVNSAVYDPATGAQVVSVYYDSKTLTAYTGGSRIEPLGTLVIPQVTAAYRLPNLGLEATLAVSAQFKDDRGSLFTESVLVKITSPQ